MPNILIELWLFGLAAAVLLYAIACTLWRGSRGPTRKLNDAEVAAGVAALAASVGFLG